MIQGQEKICNLIDNSTLDSFPRSLMLVGPSGGGKHLICDYISKKFKLTMIDITDNLDLETIQTIYERVEPYLYIIQANNITVKEENTILKFLEEPLKNSFIVLLAETDMGILPTILNRCQIWHLQNYKKDFLKTFLKTEDEFVLEIAQTPGQVKLLSDDSFVEMVALADKIISKIASASVANTLTLSNKIAFKDERGKFPIKIFVDILLTRITSCWKESDDLRYVSAYTLTSELKKNLQIKNYDAKSLFEKYLIDLRFLMRGVTV